ncbi:hypothetical protein [Plantactinospora soyae]|uniref:Uncharacterized protein n=1 Tax=Plantactinospora soyae TaxID=1544732 RepID=A0A927M2A9_9ACTN|nr:hypothetical protein [Plantactinospora soyae]MBE1485525.1 hypothetical protein [Plantactinospora soyae]
MSGESFAVELRSLTEFAQELAAQLTGMAHPLGQLTALTERELRLGAFGEAQSLGERHGVARTDLHTLVSQARDAIDFAKEVTVMVNDAYQNYDSAVAGAVNTVTGGLTSIVDGTVTGLTGPITGAGAGRA